MIGPAEERTWAALLGDSVVPTGGLPACCQRVARDAETRTFECPDCGAIWLGEDEG